MATLLRELVLRPDVWRLYRIMDEAGKNYLNPFWQHFETILIGHGVSRHRVNHKNLHMSARRYYLPSVAPSWLAVVSGEGGSMSRRPVPSDLPVARFAP